MRLLHAKDLTFYEPRPAEIPKYAILSHRWLDGEVLLHEVSTKAGRSKAGYEKIKKCGQIALEDGIDYIRVDTCCIDKSSSAELSEAINSMALWYANAAVCYAYLADVALPGTHTEEHAQQAFELKQSARFNRGWTLQELIFPKRLLFYAQDWSYIASRGEISKLISIITGISSELLAATYPQTEIDHFSTAKRMSWAAKRVTTRPEDLAYCLMGLFRVNIPLLYGEGSWKAFRRLQEAIIQKSDDHSLLAWLNVEDLVNGNYTFPNIGLLADSPSRFQYSGDIVPVPTGIGYPSFSLTKRGLYINLQIDRRNVSQALNMCVAWLDCAAEGEPNRISISLQYLPETDTYFITRRRYPGAPSAPFDAARETVCLDDLASYSTLYRSSGPTSFILLNSQLRGFGLRGVFPDAGWISKSQAILPFETSPGDWRCGFGFRQTQLGASEVVVAVVGYKVSDEGQHIWCALVHWINDSKAEDLEALVRAQTPSKDSVHHATIRIGEGVMTLEVGNRQTSNFADSQFRVRVYFS